MDSAEAQICCSVDEMVDSISSSAFSTDEETISSMDGYEADNDSCRAINSNLDDSFELVTDPDVKQMNRAHRLFTPTTESFYMLHRDVASEEDDDADDKASFDDDEDDELEDDVNVWGLSTIQEQC
ncbi:hypothetical protein JDV02_002468 [Purpureocillium takamizusanense]|uniref:Uncharacterized protein n=1 Tax=Purpureocillium takamizusanense TaxID=2060973 RepID=A0A9Q8QB17_9HYPO|nr:uncharacterized protein JDV02_002468 [Purpureocillium takamizusanense]UNI15987.1 hypothetical protein JDV02_002468 [Purpureocillium takamizusanense]